MSKIITFIDRDILFIETTLGWAVEGLSRIDPSIEVVAYSYKDLRNRSFKEDKSDCILFMEAGQFALKHGGMPVNQFKKFFPNSKVVVWASDTDYYRTNGLEDQFPANEVDFVFETMPTNISYWESKGTAAVCLPWTISRRLFHYASNKVWLLDLSKKNNDFICLMNMQGAYREDMKVALGTMNTLICGGDHHDNNLDRVIEDFQRSWIQVDSTSHVRPELTLLGGMKGFRTALGIASNCLTMNNRHRNVFKVWPIFYETPTYDYGNFWNIFATLDNVKSRPNWYEMWLKKQQKWLCGNILDELIYRELKKVNIL